MRILSWTLVSLLDQMFAAPIRYHMDGMRGKVRPISTEPSAIRFLDCSGFTEYVIHHATEGNVDLPAGSRRQWSWLERNHYQEVDYATYAPRRDDVVRIGFRAAVRRDGRRVRAGHVWLVINARTYECTTRGNNNGVASLSWSDRQDEVAAFFTLGGAPLFSLFTYFCPTLRERTRETVTA